jgi:hypothetical protein
MYYDINELLFDFQTYVDQFISNGQTVYLNYTTYCTHMIYNSNFNILYDKLVLKYGLNTMKQYHIKFTNLYNLFFIRLKLLHTDHKLLIHKKIIKSTDIMRIFDM